MSTCKVTVMVSRIHVVSNGEPPVEDAHPDKKKKNLITASLVYPRGGCPMLTSSVQFGLANHTNHVFDTSDFYGADGDATKPDKVPGLFKGELIDGECPLNIEVTTKKDTGAWVKVFEKLFADFSGFGASLAPGGTVAVTALKSVAGSLSDLINHGVSDANDKALVIGSARTRFRAAELPAPGGSIRIVLPLIAKHTVHVAWMENVSPPEGGPAHIVHKEADVITAGTANGEIELLVEVSA